MPSTVSTAAELTAVLDGPSYQLSSPSIGIQELLTWGGLTIPLPHVLPLVTQEEPESAMQCVPRLPSPLARRGRICRVPLKAEMLACGDKGGRFSSKHRSQWDALSTVGVSKSGQSIIARRLEYNAGAFQTTLLHMPMYAGHHPDLWRPGCHPGHCRILSSTPNSLRYWMPSSVIVAAICLPGWWL